MVRDTLARAHRALVVESIDPDVEVVVVDGGGRDTTSRVPLFLNLYATSAKRTPNGTETSLMRVIANTRVTVLFYFLSGVRTAGMLPRGMKREVGSL